MLGLIILIAIIVLAIGLRRHQRGLVIAGLVVLLLSGALVLSVTGTYTVTSAEETTFVPGP